jgi:hypothetical protein
MTAPASAGHYQEMRASEAQPFDALRGASLELTATTSPVCLSNNTFAAVDSGHIEGTAETSAYPCRKNPTKSFGRVAVTANG